MSERDPLLRAIAEALETHGAAAVAAARADLRRLHGGEQLGASALAWLGERVSHHLRRAVLLDALRENGWHLAATADALRLHPGASTTLRAIRALDLHDEYEHARAAGLIRRGGDRRAPRVRPRR